MQLILIELIRDFKRSFRMLLKKPVSTGAIILTLALGIGANVALFSAMKAVLFRSLPYEDPDRLFWLWETNPRIGINKVTAPPAHFVQWKNQSTLFEELAALQHWSFAVDTPEGPEKVRGARVSASLFDTLNVRPILGRTFMEEEEIPGRNSVAIISYGLWRRQFGGDPHVIGKSMTLHGADIPRWGYGEQFTVVGVLPANFILSVPSKSEIWIPLSVNPSTWFVYTSHQLSVLGRLNEGATIEQARTEIDAITKRTELATPSSSTGWRVQINSFRQELVGETGTALLIVSAAAVLLFAIACTNVTNLLLTRAASRKREFVVRLSMGASRSHLIRHLMTESVLLYSFSGLLAVCIGSWSLDLFRSLASPEFFRHGDIQLDRFTIVLTMLGSVLLGASLALVPAFRLSRANLREALQEEGQRSIDTARKRALRVLVLVQVAFAFVLLVSAALLTNSFIQILKVNPGFDTKEILTLRISLPEYRYEPRDQERFFSELLERISVLPGVKSAAVSTTLPFTSEFAKSHFSPEGMPFGLDPSRFQADYDAISSEYFAVLGVGLLEGRFFTDADREKSRPVAIVSRTMAQQFWSGRSAIGQRVRVNLDDGTEAREIIGVVDDVRHSLTEQAQPKIYVPYRQVPWAFMSTIIKTDSSNLAALVSAARRHVRHLDSGLPVYDVATLQERLKESLSRERFTMALILAFAFLALVLAATGVYSLSAELVTSRTREMGIRMALGAQPYGVLKLVLKDCMKWVSAGLLLGVVLAFLSVNVLTKLLYNVVPTDLATFTTAVILIAASGLTASYLPARRITRLDPLVALRHE